MKTLLLIRHAKSSWTMPVQDFERELTDRGIEDANLVAAHAKELLPEKYSIYSSSARRAAATAKIFANKFSYPIEKIIFLPELYTFDARNLEKSVRDLEDANDTIILFGHNEAITDFVNKFGDIFIDNVSTSGFVSLVFDTDTWRTINKGRTRNVIFPRDLKK